MKKVLETCIIGAHRKIANCTEMFSNLLADVRKVDARDVFAFDKFPDGGSVTDDLESANEGREESPAT